MSPRAAILSTLKREVWALPTTDYHNVRGLIANVESFLKEEKRGEESRSIAEVPLVPRIFQHFSLSADSHSLCKVRFELPRRIL